MKPSSRMTWLVVVGAVAASAALAFAIYRHYQRGSDADPPGVIFERSDRPARV